MLEQRDRKHVQMRFIKGEACGNDFIVHLDADGEQPLTPQQAARLCDRRRGIGADGILRAVRTDRMGNLGERIREIEPQAEWCMEGINANGTPFLSGGNALRVFVHTLLSEGLVTRTDRREIVSVGTSEGVRDVIAGVAGYSVDLGRWSLGREERNVTAPGLPGSRSGVEITVGESFVVTAVQGSAELDAIELDSDPAAENETSFAFAHPVDPFVKDGVARIRARFHQRGTAETLSSGTGAVTVALAFRHWGGPEMPNHWSVETRGGVMGVRMFATEEGEHVSVSGPATITFRGSIELPATL